MKIIIPGIISGIIYGGFIVLMGMCMRLLPETHQARLLKNVCWGWLLLFVIWQFVKNYFPAR